MNSLWKTKFTMAVFLWNEWCHDWQWRWFHFQLVLIYKRGYFSPKIITDRHFDFFQWAVQRIAAPIGKPTNNTAICVNSICVSNELQLYIYNCIICWFTCVRVVCIQRFLWKIIIRLFPKYIFLSFNLFAIHNYYSVNMWLWPIHENVFFYERTSTNCRLTHQIIYVIAQMCHI